MLVHLLQCAIRTLIFLELENGILFQILAFLAACFIWICLTTLVRYRGLPPGPWGLPVFGYLPFLKGHIHLTLGQLAVKYGPIYRIFLGNKLVVILTDHNIIREAFRLEAFSGRPITELTQILGGYGKPDDLIIIRLGGVGGLI